MRASQAVFPWEGVGVDSLTTFFSWVISNQGPLYPWGHQHNYKCQPLAAETMLELIVDALMKLAREIADLNPLKVVEG